MVVFASANQLTSAGRAIQSSVDCPLAEHDNGKARRQLICYHGASHEHDRGGIAFAGGRHNHDERHWWNGSHNGY